MLCFCGYIDNNSDSTCDSPSRSPSSISLGESETEPGLEKPHKSRVSEMPAQQVPLSSGENRGEKSIGKTKRNMPQGRKQAFAPESVGKIKSRLVEQNDRRGLALLLASLDTSLRSVDLLSLRVSDVCDHNMQVVHRFSITQRKTHKTVECSLAPATRVAIAALISAQGKVAGDYLWTAKSDVHGDHNASHVPTHR
jgi:hypothetical protein